MIDVIVPTCGRWNSTPTITALKRAKIPVKVVVQAAEQMKYDMVLRDVDLYMLPDDIITIAPTRQYIVKYVAQNNFVMIDDDLTFYMRRDDRPELLRDIYPEELRECFQEIDLTLRSYAHVGIAAREGANRNTAPKLFNTRIMRVLGYNRNVLLGEDIRFDRMEVMEDFDVALQLLEKGYPNCLLNMYAQNQSGSARPGGCSTFRTPELHAANAARLAMLHPHVVKLVEKTTKTAWGGGTRTDVIIAWKRAYEQGMKNADVRTGLLDQREGAHEVKEGGSVGP